MPAAASYARLRTGGAINALWGAAVLAQGPRLWRAAGGGALTEADRLALSALGIRHVGQGLCQFAAPARWPRLLLAVDVLHMATMVPLVVRDPARRGPAAVSGSVSLACALGALASRSEQARAHRTGRKPWPPLPRPGSAG